MAFKENSGWNKKTELQAYLIIGLGGCGNNIINKYTAK